MENYCRVRQATDDDIVGQRRFVCWITRATDIQSNVLILIAFPREKMLGASPSMLGLYVTACFVFLSM